MGGIWNSVRATRQAATALIALALVSAAVLHVANQKMVAIQGPGTLRAVDTGSLWLAVNDELWVLDAQGRRVGRRTASELGLAAAVSNIVPAPDGQVLLTSRHDAHWQVVDRRTLKPVRTIAPRWPQELSDHATGALHVAVSPDWQIAVATGGGHAVALFDAQGAFRTRTRPGTYFFTNGLAHSPEGWWTTDTNRWALHLLDASTLSVKSTLRLPAEPRGYTWLGELVPSEGRPLPGDTLAPLATLSRVGFLMEPGYAVDVFPDGRQAVYNHAPFAQLRDIAWFNGELLAVDGGSYTIHRFAPDRISLDPFGDRELQAEFRRMHADRAFWASIGSRWGLLVAALLLLLGVACYARHQKLLARQMLEGRTGERTVGEKAQARRLLRERLRIHGVPMALRVVAALLGAMLLYPLMVRWRGVAPQGAFDVLSLFGLAVLLPVLPVAFWQTWRHERLQRDPRFEATLNHAAQGWLQDHADWDRVREEGESARESVYLTGWRKRWLLVTNQRVLLFAASARERVLQQSWPRRAVAFAGIPPRRSVWARMWTPTPNLLLRLADGTELSLVCASSVSAERVARLLMQTRPGEPVAVPGAAHRRRWHEVAASFVLPGLGQLLQNRFPTGAVMLTAALLLSILGLGPVLWAATGPKMHVSTATLVQALALWLMLAAAAAVDAYHFSLRPAARR